MGLGEIKILASKIFYIRNLILYVFFLTLTAIPASLHLIAQQKYPQEDVTVIAVEVPVRVLLKGKAVKDLTKEDFEIYENGKKQEITAFEVASRKIAISREVSEDELKIPPKPRLFFLIFNIFDYNEKVGDGIDYFFENVFQPGDRFIVLTEDKLLNIDIGKTLTEIIAELKETLKQTKVISTGTTVRAYNALDYELYRLQNTSLEYGYFPYIRFIDNYIRAWKEYKRLNIYPDLRLYKSVLNRIRQIEGDKWRYAFSNASFFRN